MYEKDRDVQVTEQVSETKIRRIIRGKVEGGDLAGFRHFEAILSPDVKIPGITLA